MTHQDRILVAAGDETARREIELLLVDNGFAVKTTGDCDAVMQALDTFKPHLVILDLAGSPTASVSCCRRIKNRPETEDIKVLMISDNGERANISRAFSAGCDDYIYEPLDELALVTLVRELLQFTYLRRLLQRHAG